MTDRLKFLLSTDTEGETCVISCSRKPPRDLDTHTTITLGNDTFEVAADDLETISELGRGAYGIVEKMRHRPTGTELAVKVCHPLGSKAHSRSFFALHLCFTNMFAQRIAATLNCVEQKRLLMDLDISMRTVDCPFTVQFFGALFREGDVWICMEVMDVSLDKLYKDTFSRGKTVPESAIEKIAYSVTGRNISKTLLSLTCVFYLIIFR